MPVTTDLPFPYPAYVDMLQTFYASLNGPDSFAPVQSWDSDTYASRVYCSRGPVLEKAGFTLLNVAGGTVNGSPATLRLFETLAYPANPALPGLIIMTNMNETAAMGRMVVFLADLFIQEGGAHRDDRQLFGTAVAEVCARHGRDYEEYRAFASGQGLLAGCAAESGFLQFFTEADLPFLDDVIAAVLPAYRGILDAGRNRPAAPDAEEQRNLRRARMIDWILTENFGISIARENGIPLATIEAYGFPPSIRY